MGVGSTSTSIHLASGRLTTRLVSRAADHRDMSYRTSLSAARSLTSSSPSSFHTAAADSSNNADDEITALSTPGEPAASSYRMARPLPDELTVHVKIWFEERMCEQ